jgi:cell division protein FtsL
MMSSRSRVEAWRVHTSYNYGATAVQEAPEISVPQHRPAVRTIHRTQPSGLGAAAIRFALTLGVVLSLCAVNTMLARAYVKTSNHLIRLKKQEARLLDENETLKIDVSRLKSPDRIADIASKKLGLSTAKNNIYVSVGTPAKKR